MFSTTAIVFWNLSRLEPTTAPETDEGWMTTADGATAAVEDASLSAVIGGTTRSTATMVAVDSTGRDRFDMFRKMNELPVSCTNQQFKHDVVAATSYARASTVEGWHRVVMTH